MKAVALLVFRSIAFTPTIRIPPDSPRGDLSPRREASRGSQVGVWAAMAVLNIGQGLAIVCLDRTHGFCATQITHGGPPPFFIKDTLLVEYRVSFQRCSPAHHKLGFTPPTHSQPQEPQPILEGTSIQKNSHKIVMQPINAGEWFTSLDLKDAYFHNTGPFSALAALAPLQLQGITILPYLDDWLICAPSLDQVILGTEKVLGHV